MSNFIKFGCVCFSFSFIGQEIVWEGKGDTEIGKDKASGKIRVKVNPKFYRPTEVEELLGDSTKARAKLGWAPKVDFDMLVKDMMESDLELMKKNPNAWPFPYISVLFYKISTIL